MVARATGLQPDVVLTLSDGTSTVGIMTPDRTGLRRLPRGPGVERKQAKQAMFTGGRGNARFSQDATRFYDSMAWTMIDGQVILPPLFVFSDINPILKSLQRMPTARQNDVGFFLTTVPVTASEKTRNFTANYNFTTTRVYLWLRKVGTPDNLTVTLRQGVTDLATKTVTAAEFTDFLTVLFPVVWSSGVALTTSTTYTLAVSKAGSASATDYWEIGTDNVGGSFGLFYRFTDDGLAIGGGHSSGASHLFEYQNVIYAAMNRSDQNAPHLLINGDRGQATGGTTTTLTDSTKAWTTNQWSGAVLMVFDANYRFYRYISSNTATTIAVSPALPGAAGTGTSYAILGSEWWTEITGHGLTNPVTSVAVFNQIVYFAQGDFIDMRRMREYNNAGTWTREFAADTGNKAQLLMPGPHWNDGSASLYRAVRNVSQVSLSPIKTWGTNLVFETAMDVGTVNSWITGLTVYNNSLWAGKEDGIFTLKNGKFGEVPIAMRPARDERNCVAILGWNTNLYFSFMSGLERLYGQVVDDIGPDRDQGMPLGRRGAFTGIVPVMGYMFCGYAGLLATDKSAILATTSPGGDWHEIFRAFEAGKQITSIYYQSIPYRANKLWIVMGNQIGSLCMPDDAHNPRNDDYVRMAPEGYVTTSWYDFDTPELDHYFDELRFLTENAQATSTSNLKIEVDYQTDVAYDSTVWTRFPLASIVTTSPYKKLAIGNGLVTGNRIRFRLRILGDVSGSIILNSTELRANQMNEALYDVTFDFRSGDRITLLNGNDSTGMAIDAINVLESWKEDATLLTMRVALPGGGTIFDNLVGHIDPVSMLTAEWNDQETTILGSITLKTT